MRRRSGWCWTAWTRGPWPGPCSAARAAARVLAGGRLRSVRGYRARRAARQVQALARGRLRAVAVDGKTCRGARRPDGTRVHLLGIAEHGGHLLDHLEVDVKHNETSHFTELPGPVDLDGAVVTFDALHTVRANLDWLVTGKKVNGSWRRGVPAKLGRRGCAGGHGPAFAATGVLPVRLPVP